MSDIVSGNTALGEQPLVPSSPSTAQAKVQAAADCKALAATTLNQAIASLQMQRDALPESGPFDDIRLTRSALGFCIGQLQQRLKEIGA